MINIVHHNADQLFEQVSHLIAEARSHVARAVNSAMVTTYYEIGRHIVENEQNGQQRAQYGKQVLQELSARLTAEFGKGWSVETLTNCRKFFSVYSKSYPVVTNSQDVVSNGYEMRQFVLPWSHYLILMREENPAARKFYEIESQRQQWSKRQLQRQVASSLYERLALSRDKDEVMRLAQNLCFH